MITVIGLGVEKGDLTERGKARILQAVKDGGKIAVRTAKVKSYQTVQELGVEHICLDGVYENSRNFATLAKNLAKAVVELGENAVYLVDGSATEDTSVKALVKRLRGKIEIIDGVSKTTAVARAVQFSACSYTAKSAYELLENAAQGKTDRPSLPLIVYDMDDRAVASDCKLLLGDLFGEETQVKFVQDNQAKKIALYELDRQKKYDYSTAVAIDEQDLLEKTRFSVDDLREIIVRLRRPDGCPWDKVQTNDSIKMSAVEEAYELVDAIDQDDDEKIMEETGDVILQAVFHSVIKEQTGSFNLTDAVSGLCQKLIFRHSHVFGNDTANSENSALNVWEKNKMQEKHQLTYADAVNDVPKCFPAAMRAQKIGKRAAKAGMDFATAEDAAARLQEELKEFFDARKTGNQDETEKELGDLLFACVNIGRKAGCDCEKALKESAERFAKRFTLAEEMARKDHADVTKLNEKEWDKYYLKAKEELKKQ